MKVTTRFYPLRMFGDGVQYWCGVCERAGYVVASCMAAGYEATVRLLNETLRDIAEYEGEAEL